MKYKRKNTFIKHLIKLPIFSLLVVFLFASCDSAIFEKKQPEQAQSLCTVYGKIAPKYNGAYPSQIFGDSQLQNKAGRSAFAGVQTGTYSVTATKCIQNEGSWSLSTNDDDIITALPGDVGIDEVTGTGAFAIRLSEGSWYLSAKLNNEDKLLLETPELDSLTEDDIVTINTTDKTYDKNISITVSPKITESGTGNVSLDFFYDVTQEFLASLPENCTFSMKISPAYISENEDIVEQTAYIAEGDFDENGNATVELSNIPSGSYKYLFCFLIKTGGITMGPGFLFQETINVFDNLTTNCWVKDSVTDDSNDAKIYLTLKDNPSIPNEAECKITDDCINLKNESNTYEVSTEDDLSQALSTIRYANEMYDGNESLRPEYKIIVDGTIIDEDETNIPTIKLKNTTNNPITKPINITICGKTPQATIKRTSTNESSNIIEIDDDITVTLTLYDITLEGGAKAVKTSQNTIINIKGKVLTKDNYIDFADGAVMNVIAPLSDDSKICFNTPAADCVFVKDESQNLTKSPDQYFVHKDGYRVGYKLDDTGNEIKTDIKVYGANNGSITQKIEDNISFQLTYPEQVKYYNNTFYLYNGYANTTDYEKGQIKVQPFVDGNLLTVSDDFNITVASLVSENPEDGELLTSETDSELKYKTFQLKTSNQKLGKYIVTATLNYNGKTYSTSWNVEVYDFEYKINNRVIPVGSSQTFDVKTWYCNGSERKEIPCNVNINKITAAYLSENKISCNSSNVTNSFSTSTQGEYIVSTNVIYQLDGETSPYAECIENTFYSYVNNTIPFFVHPSFTGTSTGDINAPFTNINDAINHIETINDGNSTYAIYLMGDVIAQSEDDFVDVFNKQINESGTLYGKTFVRINATDDNTAPLKLKITSYGAPVNQYAINANCTGPDAQTAISGVTARVMFVGKNAELTLEKVQITGGKSSNSGIAPADIGTAILVFGKVIFNSGLIGSTSYQTNPVIMNDDSLCANTNSSVFLEKNSSFIMNGGEFNGYYTGIYVNELANCEINGGRFSVGNTAINGNNSDLIKVENCSFEKNSLDKSKRLFTLSSSTLSLKNCIISGNYVISSSPAYASGVLIFANSSDVFIDGCTIGNTCDPQEEGSIKAITGGAVYFYGSDNTLQIKDTTFENCATVTNQTVTGGCLYIANNATVTLMENYSANEDIYLCTSNTITLDESFSLKEGCDEVQITLDPEYSIESGTQILLGELSVIKNYYDKFNVKVYGSTTEIELNERGQIR